jgi:homoserine dehydrogenase
MSVIVLKFGSSVLRSESDLPSAVHEIYRWWRRGKQVVAVVSAFGDTTDELTRRANEACDEPDDALVAALLATGEAASSALLGLALNKAGIPTTVLDAERAGLTTVGTTLDSNLVSVDAASLLASLAEGVVVLPGFVGRSQSGQTTLLGRGGSDLTALFLAQRLGGICRLVKDVDGLYTSDPNTRTANTVSRFMEVSYATARRVGGAVVQAKAVEFAEKHRQRFFISSIGSERTTEVGPVADRIAIGERAFRRLRVALLGCGTIGGGVYKRLAALPHLFEVVAVGTRNVEGAISEDVPVRLITTHLEQLVDSTSADVVVELIGGLEPARTLIAAALGRGCDVVTANKALLAADTELIRLAAVRGRTIRYSAAVGGGTPALESVRVARETATISAISGVINGTTNFILDELATGANFSFAVKRAQDLGYAEADPTLDLDGTDAAQKLILLAREAFDVDIPLTAIWRKGIDEQTTSQSGFVRLVAECRRVKTGFETTVTPVQLEPTHPLAQVKGVSNRLLIETTDGQVQVITGRGAGRWPTTEAVLADLIDLVAEVNSEVAVEEEECVA